MARSPEPPEPLGVLTARAWLEDGDAGRLRVRMTATTDVLGVSPQHTVVATVDEACDELRRWLESVLREHGAG